MQNHSLISFAICAAFGILAAVFAGTLAHLLMSKMRMFREAAAAKSRLLGKSRRAENGLLPKIFMPAIDLLSPRLKGVRAPGLRKFTAEKIMKAGLDESLRVEEVWAYQISLAAFLALVGLMTFPDELLVTALAAAGFFCPVLFLGEQRKKRLREIDIHLPQFLDLLSLSVEAGLDFVAAVARIAERGSPSIVTKEFGRMVGRLKLGMTRGDALLELKSRLAHPSADLLAGLLIQADRLGTSIGAVLKANAERMRMERWNLAERAGEAAAEKLLFPLIFCIMPAVSVIIFGPLFVMWRTGMIERMFN